MSASIASVGEQSLIARLRTRVGAPAPFVTIGIGDDAAVVVPERGEHDVITTDCLVEGVHFRRDWTRLSAIGHKALAVNLSDLGAMGATPRASLLSLGLPDGFSVADFDELVDGFVTLADASGARLIGGNLTRSPGPLFVDATALGAVRPRRVLRRDTARLGHHLYVTGSLGAAATGLAMLTAGVSRETMNDDAAKCVERYERPDSRERCGRIVARSGSASAAMDLSDGLADAARRIAEASGAGVVIEADTLPVHAGARAWAAREGTDAMRLALEGGEDYELAFAVPPRQRSKFAAALRRCHDLPITRIGRFVAEPGAWLERAGALEPLGHGFSHF